MASTAETITVDGEITQAVDTGVTIGQRVHRQAHVPAAEEQPMVVEQGGGGEREVLPTAQGTVVVHAAGIQGQVGGGGQSTTVAQQTIHRDQAVTAAGNARVLCQLQLPGGQG